MREIRLSAIDAPTGYGRGGREDEQARVGLEEVRKMRHEEVAESLGGEEVLGGYLPHAH